MIGKLKNNPSRIAIIALIGLSSACASMRSTTASPENLPRATSTERTPLVSPETIRRYVHPELPVVTAPNGPPPNPGGEGFVAPRGQTIEMPYDVLCIDARAQAAVEANIAYRDQTAQNNCSSAVRILGAQAARDLSLVDAAAATRENTLNAQINAATDSLTSTNRTLNDLRDQITSNSRFATLVNFIIAVGGVAVGAGIAALISGLSN